MARCRVGYVDVFGVRHEVELSADTLFEAVALAVAQFRKHDWIECHPTAAEFTVSVQPAPPVVHTIKLAAVEQFAKYGAVKGPKDILRKKRIRAWLKLDPAGMS